MHWEFEFFTGLMFVGALLTYWIDFRVKFAVVQSDLRWMKAALKSLGANVPDNGS